MFDLFTGKVQHVPSTPAIPILVSSTIQGTALAVIALMSFVVASRELPPVPDMFAFVADIPAVAPPPPPPPPPVPQGPVRIGGQLSAPALVKRVEPVYPAIAQAAAIDGIVILDAIVDEHGRIQSLKVLRGHALLAKAAIAAVEQWEYEPLKLNGTPTPFELTVSLWFHFDEKARRRS